MYGAFTRVRALWEAESMAKRNSEGLRGQISLEDAKDEFIAERDGNYASNLEYALEKWIDWTGDHVQTLDGVSKRTMRNYAGHLKRRQKATLSARRPRGRTTTTSQRC